MSCCHHGPRWPYIPKDTDSDCQQVWKAQNQGMGGLGGTTKLISLHVPCQGQGRGQGRLPLGQAPSSTLQAHPCLGS